MMNREDLIKKWLDNNLNADELIAFKKLKDYDAIVKLSNATKHFKAPEYNTSEELNLIQSKLKTSKNVKKPNFIKPLLRIAAILVITFGLYFYTTTLDTTINTLAAQKTEISLPDNSSVDINALSSVTYNKKKWNSNRTLELQGEAYFKVAKGSTFIVNTSIGKVTVYGTQFNIKQRENYFEVICYEGLVGVTYKEKETQLKPGERFLILNGKLIAKEKETQLQPSWISNESTFKSLPFKEVIAEFERQYNRKITLKNVDIETLFTGKFTHQNIDTALKSITLPLNLSYSKTNKRIILKRD